jgi:hypothetical protein
LTIPVIAAVGTGPQKRLSADSPRKSPARNHIPGGTLTAVGSSHQAVCDHVTLQVG